MIHCRIPAYVHMYIYIYMYVYGQTYNMHTHAHTNFDWFMLTVTCLLVFEVQDETSVPVAPVAGLDQWHNSIAGTRGGGGGAGRTRNCMAACWQGTANLLE